MDEDQAPQLLGLGPDRMELRVSELQPLDAAADRHAPQPELLDAVLHLLDRKVGVLQRQRRKGNEAIRLGGDELRELLVLQLDQCSRDIAVRRVPEWIDAERLD